MRVRGPWQPQVAPYRDETQSAGTRAAHWRSGSNHGPITGRKGSILVITQTELKLGGFLSRGSPPLFLS